MPIDRAGMLALVGFGGYVLVATAATVWRGLRKERKAQMERDDSFERNTRGRSKDHSLPPAKKQHALVTAAKMLTCPLLAIGALWKLGMAPAAVLGAVPALFRSYGASLESVLPVYAKDVAHAFRLGEAHQQYLAAKDAGGAALAAVLKHAAELLGRAVTAEEMAKLPETMRLQATEASLASKVLGAFSIVNIVWFVSILGLSALLLPFLYHVLAPLRKLMWNTWEKVILPFLIKCKPVYEPLLYVATLVAACEAARFPRGPHDGVSMTGTMTAVSALGLFVASWFYSTYLHSTGGGDKETWFGLSCLLFSAAAAPMAILHQSSLLGYLTVVPFVTACGFTAFGGPLCLYIGFGNRTEALRTAASCLFMTLGYAALKALGLSGVYVAPFASAVASFGTAVYFLALSILTFSGWGGFKHVGEALYAFNLVAFWVVGELVGIPGMRNAAKAWGFFEFFILYVNYCPKDNVGVGIVSSFIGCGLLYAASLYLNTHPEIVVAAMGAASNASL